MDDISFPPELDAAALIDLGRASRKQRDHGRALEHFLAAQSAAPGNRTAALEVAATLLALQRHDEAEAAFRRVLARAPSNATALVGLGELALARNDPTAALDWFERAGAAEPCNVSVALHIGRTLRVLDRMDEAEACFLRVLERAPRNANALTNLGMLARKRGDHAASIDYFERAVANNPERDVAQLNLADSLRAAGRIDEAEARYHAILARRPGDAACLQGVGDIARARGDHAAALASFRAAAAASTAPTLVLQLRIAEMLRELACMAEAEAMYQSILQADPNNIAALLSYGTFELRRQKLSAALEAFEAARALAPDDPNVLFRVAAALRASFRYDDAGAILTEIARAGSADETELRRHWFEHYCMTLNLGQAEQCLDAWGGHGNVPTGVLALVARFYAAVGRGADLLAFFRERVVERGWVGKYDAFAEPLARAARATGRYAEVLELLARVPAASQASIRGLLDQIAEEMQLRGILAQSLAGPAATAGSADVSMIADPFRATRADLLAGALLARHPDRPSLHIYTCTDAAYLAGAAVAIFSFLQHNAGRLRAYSVTVFCADEVIELAAAVFGRIGAGFAVSIDVRPASRLVTDTIGFRTEWGVFTAGRGLSRAAYYRIYAARHFIDEGMTGRALYIDADTCVFGGLDQFAAFDLAGRPLAACMDDPDLPTIRRAAQLLGLDPNRYFNSGVLLFDLEHTMLRSLLDRAIEISLTEQHRLTFVDQCALNLAFQGSFAALPRNFNGFVKPGMVADEIPVDPVIMHFTSQPKPWDTMYDTPNCMPWIRAFAEMGQLVAPELMRQLLALHYPAAAAPGAPPTTRPPQ